MKLSRDNSFADLWYFEALKNHHEILILLNRRYLVENMPLQAVEHVKGINKDVCGAKLQPMTLLVYVRKVAQGMTDSRTFSTMVTQLL